MRFPDMIEAAAKQTGSQAELAKQLRQTESHLSSAKKGRRGLPDAACATIAEILAIPFGQVIAARNEALAKDQATKDFWRPLARQERKAAAWTLAIATSAFLGLTAPRETHANVTSQVTPHTDTPVIMRLSGYETSIMPIMRCWMSSLDGMPRSSVDSMCGNFQRRRLAWLHLRSRRLLVSLRNDWLVAVKHLPQVPEVLRQRMRGG